MSVRDDNIHISQNRNNSWKYRKYFGIVALGLLFMPLLSFLAPASALSVTELEETEFQLFMVAAAPKLPADGNSYYAMIQLQSVLDEEPIVAPEDLEIKLISSDPSVVVLPESSVTLKAGETMAKVKIDTTDKAGLASITALSEGVKPATTSVTTFRMDSLDPSRLAIYAAPPSFIPDPQFKGIIYIQVLNSQNLPASSKIDIAVDLSSSESTVGTVPSFVVLPAGSSGVTVDFTPQKQIGQTKVKASAPGLAPGEMTVAVDGSVGSKLVVEFAPDIIPSVSYHDAMMTVQLTDGNDKPVKAGKNINVLLKSSDTSVVEVPQSVEIAAGKSYALVYAKAKGTLGDATITATSTGYQTGFNTMKTVELSTASLSDPKVLKLYTVPRVLPPDNSEHQAIVVAFLDKDEKPYRQTGWLYSRIALSTSNTQVGEITSTTFTSKETYAIAKFKTKYAIGVTTLTASLEGYEPSQMTMTVDGSGPAAVVLTQIPAIVEANNFGSESLVVSLVDHYGKAVAAQEDTVIFLSSSDPEIVRVQASTTIQAGETHAVTDARPSLRAGQTTITGAAAGLASGSLDFRTVGFTGSQSEYHLGLYTMPKLPADGKEYEAIVVQLQDQAGLPVLAKSNVEVSLSSSSVAGSVEERVVIPAGSSLITGSFRTSLIEDEELKVTASSQGFKSVEATLETTLQPLIVYRASDFPAKTEFGNEIQVAVDVFSGATAIENAIVTITGTAANETTVMTDENGHAEGAYFPTLPGSNSIIIKANKPGYEEATLSSRISLIQTVNVLIRAETEGGNELTAQLKVDTPTGIKNQVVKPGSPIKYDNARWGEYKVTAQTEIKATNAVYHFAGWSDGATENPRKWNVIGNTEITAIYEASYLVQISDPMGLARGSGYYDEGTTATITTGQTSVGGFLIDKNFDGWSGDIKSSLATTDVLVDGPKTIKAEWKDSYLKIALIAAAAAGGGFFYYWKIFKPKKELEEKQRAPDLDWYKA